MRFPYFILRINLFSQLLIFLQNYDKSPNGLRLYPVILNIKPDNKKVYRRIYIMTFGNVFFLITILVGTVLLNQFIQHRKGARREAALQRTREIERAHWRHVLRNYNFVFADDMEENTSENCKAVS